jgi:hypothetical protein
VSRPKPKTDTFGLGYDPSTTLLTGTSGDQLALHMSRERHQQSGGIGLLTAGAYHTNSLVEGGAVPNRKGKFTYPFPYDMSVVSYTIAYRST